MSVITVAGSLASIRGSLRRLREVVRNQEAMGFRVLVHTAEWLYLTERDERVCPYCRRYQGTIHRGDDIPRRFPAYRFLDGYHIAPDLHTQYPFLKGPCRCTLELMNAGEVCEAQLHVAKVAVV